MTHALHYAALVTFVMFVTLVMVRASVSSYCSRDTRMAICSSLLFSSSIIFCDAFDTEPKGTQSAVQHTMSGGRFHFPFPHLHARCDTPHPHAGPQHAQTAVWAKPRIHHAPLLFYDPFYGPLAAVSSLSSTSCFTPSGKTDCLTRAVQSRVSGRQLDFGCSSTRRHPTRVS